MCCASFASLASLLAWSWMGMHTLRRALLLIAALCAPLVLAAAKRATKAGLAPKPKGAPRPSRAPIPLPLLEAAAAGDALEVAQLVTLPGADVNVRADGGITALHVASTFNQTAAVRVLLAAASVLVDARDEKGITPLFLAAQHGFDEIVELLLGAGADANAAEKEDATSPLMVAAVNGHAAVVVALLSASPPAVIEAKTKPSGQSFTALLVRVYHPTPYANPLLCALTPPHSSPLRPRRRRATWTPCQSFFTGAQTLGSSPSMAARPCRLRPRMATTMSSSRSLRRVLMPQRTVAATASVASSAPRPMATPKSFTRSSKRARMQTHLTTMVGPRACLLQVGGTMTS